MGMYTRIKCIFKTKKKYFKDIDKIIREGDWDKSTIDQIREFGKDERTGYLKGRPVDHNVWEVNGEVKNYDDTIEHFINDVLILIAEEVYFLETEYEEDLSPTIYDIVNGEVIILKYPYR